MKNHRTHKTRFLIIVAIVIIGCYAGLRAGRTSGADSAKKATPPPGALPTLLGRAAIGRELEARMKLAGDQMKIEAPDDGAIYPAPIDPTLAQEAKLKASDAAAGDNFGFNMAINGDTAVVGAALDDDGDANSGSAYVFVRSGTGWSQQAKLTASDASAGDRFGISVGISGNTIVVGADLADDAGSISGSAYVFVRSGTSWIQQAKLTASDAAMADQFGFSVAIDGNTVVVGAVANDAASRDAGSAYVFVRSGTNWSEQAKLTASDAEIAAVFGWAVAIRGDTAVIGAPQEDHAAFDDGAAYVFVRSGTTWSEQAKLTASDGAQEDRFGRNAVGISGETVVVGAPFDDTAAGADAGSAYVFVRSGTNWNEQAKLIAGDAAAGDRFGISVGISGETVVVGARFDDDAGTDSGSAYVFERSGTNWSQQQKLTASDAAEGDQFGFSVAIDENAVVVGAFLDDDGGTDSGSAYVFAPSLNPQEMTIYLRGIGPSANPPTLFLETTAPTDATAKYKDSPSVNFNGGNLWKEVGVWRAAPSLTVGSLTALSDLHVWLGLKNSDDQGANFDLRVEVSKNGALVATGESYCIRGLTRNQNLAKEATVSFAPFAPATLNGATDELSLKVLTRIGSDGAGGFCGGHSNAVGLRLYFDSVSRSSRFNATIAP